LRVVDYKTGRAPSELFEGKALFQMKFYALVLWRSRGVVPTLLQLVYLRDGQVLRYAPDEQDLLATERKIRALWVAIERAARTGDWRPSPGRLCDWCHHRDLCPAWGGTPPPLPEDAALRAIDPRATGEAAPAQGTAD
jgi:putative RecB family exonuclease